MGTVIDLLAAEQETIIQHIAWELFDPRSKVTAEFPGSQEIDDSRRGAIDELLRFRIMTPAEQLRVGHLVRKWRELESRRDRAPGSRKMHLRIVAEGASDQQLSRGLKAAAAVFEAGGVSPQVAALACARREMQDDLYGFDETAPGYPAPLSDDEHKWADVWNAANQAAIAACCAGWTAPPRDAGLSLVRNLPVVQRRGPYIEFEAE